MADTLFGALGFPPLDRETTLSNRTKEQTALFNKLVAEQAAALPARDRAVFSTFAQLGSAIAGKPPATLTPDEIQKFSIIENANREMKAQKADPNFRKLDSREKALRSQEAIAQAAFDAGDIQTFSQLSLDAATKRQAFSRSDKEMEKIDVEIEEGQEDISTKKKTREIVNQRFGVEKQGESGSFAIPDADGTFNFGESPDLVTGFLGQDGKLRTNSGVEHNAFLTPEDFDRFADNLATREKNLAAAGKSRGGKTPMDRFLTNYNSAERKAARLMADDVDQQAEIIGRVGRAMENAIKREGSANAVIGTAGGFIKFADNMFQTTKGVISGFTPSVKIGGKRNEDGTITGGSLVTGVAASAREFKDFIELPEGVTENSADAAAYRSAIMQAVYVDARLAEPGARQLSDADIKNAMDRLGTNSGNPAHVFQVLMQNFNRRTAGVRTKINRVRSVGQSMGVSADNAEQAIFGTGTIASIDRISKSLDNMGQAILGIEPEAKSSLESPQPAQAAPQTSDDIQSIIDNLPSS